MYMNYNGFGMQMALYFAALLFIVFQKKEVDKKVFFVGYAALFFLISFFPLSAKIIMEYCIGAEVYWRMFWLLPTAVVTAYVGVTLISMMKLRSWKYLVLGSLLVTIMLTGTNVYNGTIFDAKQNNYKLPQNTIDICDIIERDAAQNGITQKKLITTNDLVQTIRQYDATVQMPYGSEAIKGLNISTYGAEQIFRIMSANTKDWEALSYYAAAEQCNYLAYPAEEALTETLAEYGYIQIGISTGGYAVYRYERTAESFAGEWLITQYGNKDGNQLMFYTIEDMQGHLIVVDGGWTTDADYVKSVLKSLGNHVDAWILTHPHQDHIGAFNEIWQNPGKLTVDRVYAVDMALPELCMENAPWDETEQYTLFQQLTISQLTYVQTGDTFDIYGLTLEVLSAYNDQVDELSNDLLNDGSMLFRLKGNTQAMLFCSDVGKSMSDYLLETYGESLKSDYIQMGHHGNGGLKKDFYDMVEPEAALFDAPDWLMHDTTGRYTNPQTTYWMASNGAKIISFATTPNQILLK